MNRDSPHARWTSQFLFGVRARTSSEPSMNGNVTTANKGECMAMKI